MGTLGDFWPDKNKKNKNQKFNDSRKSQTNPTQNSASVGKQGQNPVQNEYTSKNSIITGERMNEIINLSSDNVMSMIKSAEQFAKDIRNVEKGSRDEKYNGISSSKLRDFYDYVLSIELNEDTWFIKLHLLKPKMAYHTGKSENANKAAFQKFESVMASLIDKIDNKDKKEEFKNFKTFFEAVVAYHKIYSKE